jgi:putative transposase
MTAMRPTGAPRIHRLLREEGLRIGRKRVARLMRCNGLVAKSKRRFRPQGEVGKQHLVAFSRPKSEAVTDCNQLWVGDVTYIKCGARYVYLAAVMDFYNRQIVGWHVGHQRGGQLAVMALKRAIERHRPPAGLIFHSDQGIEYANYALRSLLYLYGIQQSMSRRGNCYGNAHMESFFHTLKTECLYHEQLDRLDQAQMLLFQYIDAFYNTRRPHSSLDYLSPEEYQNRHASGR